MAINFTDGLFGNEDVSFEMICCCNCKVPFMVTSAHRKILMDKGNTFYCPNGHPQHYTETEFKRTKSELDKAKKEIADLEKWNNQISIERWELEKQLRDAKKTTCEHCGKRYLNIDAHIKKHHTK